MGGSAAAAGDGDAGRVCWRSCSELNASERHDGILVQSPLPAAMGKGAAQQVFDAIDPAKDVDGFHPVNVGRLVQGRALLAPCTPSGVIEMLDRSGDRDCGRARGRHRAAARSSASRWRCCCCSATRRSRSATRRRRTCRPSARQADILVAAIGRPGFVTPDFVKPGATVIDVGISRLTDEATARQLFAPGSPRLADFARRGSLVVGDVHPAVADIAGALTPVPGGVGPLTIAMLLKNTVDRGPVAPRHAVNPMLRAALTGGIATGKSFCLARFAALGVPVIDADVLARERSIARSRRPGRGRRALRRAASCFADGALDRAALGRIVFSDRAARADLEAIVHPRVYRRIGEWFADLPSGTRVAHRRHPAAVRDRP